MKTRTLRQALDITYSKVFRAVVAAALLLVLQPSLRAHDIPDEIVLQTYVRPEANRLQVLLRVPLIAITDANLPKDGPGYLALRYLDPALREAANQIANGIVFLEENERLLGYELANARISLPSDRSFDTYEGALARVRGERLPDSTQVYYNQGFLDLELSFPIRSQDSAFAMRVLFGRGMANRTATVINFIRPDGAVRMFRIHDETPLVHLDPKAHQAAWVFLTAGFYQFLESLDHLLFVVVLALPYRRARDLIKPMAAFALAHSVALAFAAFGRTPADVWFTSTIGAITALSIVYTALENGLSLGFPERPGALQPGLGHRWIVALLFGIFHGFGFSIALQDTLQFAGAHPLAALVSYNVGLELGTIIILAISVPALNLLVSLVPERAGVLAASILAGHAGWHWMTERAAIARLTTWPPLDLTLLLTLVRWLLAVAVAGGALWFLAGLLKRKPDIEEVPEKSIVDRL